MGDGNNFAVVLVNPEIPHNTGAIGRLCVGLDIPLHLVRPLGFSLTDRMVKRCGLDYWEHLRLKVHESFDGFLATLPPAAKLRFFSAHGEKELYDVQFTGGEYLVFGSESSGLPASIRERHSDRFFRIPMPGEHARSINLANSVSIAAYEAFRQLAHRGPAASV